MWVDRKPLDQIWKESVEIQSEKRCDEYGEDQLNVASKNLAKYLFDGKDSKKHLEDIWSMNDCSDENFILNFRNIWQNIWKQIFILKFGQFCIIERKRNRFLIKNEH